MTSTNPKHSNLHSFTLAIIMIVAILAACNWFFQPDAAWVWIRAMLFLPVIWGCMTLFKRWVLRIRSPRPGDESVRRYSEAAGRFFLLLIAAIGVLQTISLSFKLAAILGFEAGPEFPGRIKILGVGIVSILIGNALPKILTPQSLLPEGGALRITTARRFVGWTWVLLGLVTALISIFLPFDLVKLAGKWMFIGGMLAILGAIVWINLGPRRRQA
jgi:hypothetical protein